MNKREKLEDFINRNLFRLDDDTLIEFFKEMACNGDMTNACDHCPVNNYCYDWMLRPGHLNDDPGEIISSWLKKGCD